MLSCSPASPTRENAVFSCSRPLRQCTTAHPAEGSRQASRTNSCSTRSGLGLVESGCCPKPTLQPRQAMMRRLSSILSWPVEWPVLHGIAEIRTPTIKLAPQPTPLPTNSRTLARLHAAGRGSRTDQQKGGVKILDADPPRQGGQNSRAETHPSSKRSPKQMRRRRSRILSCARTIRRSGERAVVRCRHICRGSR
jgi:hypothetical protein